MNFETVSTWTCVKSNNSYLAVVLVATGLAVTGFLFSGAGALVFVAALAVGAVAVDNAPGRSEARLVLGGAGLTGSFAAAGFGTAFVATGFDTTGFGFAATAGAAVFGVVGVLGIDLGSGLLPAGTFDVDAFVVEIAAGFLISAFGFATGVPFALPVD
jgi:hypothetical protein